MGQSVKKIIINTFPEYLLKPIATVFRMGKVIRYRVDMMLFPQKMERFCPCCGMRFRSFVSGDYRERPHRFNPSRYEYTRQDVICPICKAMPRHRILAQWFEEHIELLESSKILYFAPHRAMALWMKRHGIRYTSANLYEEADLQLDIQATGLPDESYDMIVCNHVLEHVDDFRVALHEVYRVLRTGGTFICSVPMDPKVELLDEDPLVLTDEERLRRFGQNDHKRVFGMRADQFLTEVGFAVEKIVGESYPEEILPVVGPADYDMNCLFYCKK